MRKIMVCLLALLSFPSLALEGIVFSTEDSATGHWNMDASPTNYWDLVCDNSGTCRMVGYFDYYVSVYFERKAGNKQPIIGKIKGYKDDKSDYSYIKGKLFVNNRYYGDVETVDNNPYEFTEKQVDAILTALAGKGRVEIRRTGNSKTVISNKGATAVMLKMDEFQQRLNTPSALVKRGKVKKQVLQPQAIPKIKRVKIDNLEAVCETEYRYSDDRGFHFENNKCNFSETILNKILSANSDSYGSIYNTGWRVFVHSLSDGYELIEQYVSYSKMGVGTIAYILTDVKRDKIYDVIPENERANFITYPFSSIIKEGDIYHSYYDRDNTYSVWNGERFILANEEYELKKGFNWRLPIFISDIVEPDKISTEPQNAQ